MHSRRVAISVVLEIFPELMSLGPEWNFNFIHLDYNYHIILVNTVVYEEN